MNMFDEDYFTDEEVEFCYTMYELAGFLLALLGLYNILVLLKLV